MGKARNARKSKPSAASAKSPVGKDSETASGKLGRSTLKRQRKKQLLAKVFQSAFHFGGETMGRGR
jgi:hypothetical protein